MMLAKWHEKPSVIVERFILIPIQLTDGAEKSRRRASAAIG
jgi:hypothetical protein